MATDAFTVEDIRTALVLNQAKDATSVEPSALVRACRERSLARAASRRSIQRDRQGIEAG